MALLLPLTALVLPKRPLVLPGLSGRLTVYSLLPAALFAGALPLHAVFLTTPAGLCLSLCIILPIFLPLRPVVIALTFLGSLTPRLHSGFEVSLTPQVVTYRAGVCFGVRSWLSRSLATPSRRSPMDVNVRQSYLLR